jgi:deoxyribodipyrimidine photo-lyase
VTNIVWFRQDLRKRDNPALAAAAARGRLVPVYILDDVSPPPRHRLGAASRWWLHHSLEALRADLGGLLLLRGDPREILPQLARDLSATCIFWNRCYEPFAVARDASIKASLRALGIEVHSFNGSLLFEPWEISNRSGDPFRVFTPFWRTCLSRPVPTPLAKSAITVEVAGGREVPLSDWGLLPRRPNWTAGWESIWRPGETGALDRLETFVSEGLAGYREKRDRPDRANVSRLSPHLHFGELSTRSLWARLMVAVETGSPRASVEKFLSELGWREFAYHLLYHFPSLPDRNWRSSFDSFAWRESDPDLRAWQRGQTGYPLVDAGMRQLWQTGWMHNRVRMIAASFLTKHLRIDWRVGEAWFWDTLVDADLANNAAGWQWVAGSGADAAPFFRIFNPTIQGRKFDPDGNYVRRWCPELAGLPTELIHAPFEADATTLARAGIVLGETYPAPIVDHWSARKAALDAYQATV